MSENDARFCLSGNSSNREEARKSAPPAHLARATGEFLVKEPTKDIAGTGGIVRNVRSGVIMKLILILDFRPALAGSVPPSVAVSKVTAQPRKSLVVGLKEQIATRGFGSLLFWPMRL
jgi:hypothetical protein